MLHRLLSLSLPISIRSTALTSRRTIMSVYPDNPSSLTDLLTALPAKFEEARQSGQLFFFPSQSKDVYSKGRRFNLRTCPALLDKAKAKSEALAAINTQTPEAERPKRQDEDASKQNAAEPFKPPYVAELYLGCVDGLEGESGMSILLNKYAVLPEHMLLCPPQYEPQALPPTPHQLALAYLLMIAAARHPTRPRKLMAFYNGGEGAGASQRWRHLQFVELKDRAPIEEWTDMVKFNRHNEPVLHPDMPYVHIVYSLGNLRSIPFPPTTEQSSQLVDELVPALMKSLDLAIDAVRRGHGDKHGGWNLIMTLDHLHLIPRSAPQYSIESSQKSIELNALGYAGMILVRSEEEESELLDSVKDQGLLSALEKCGVPRSWGEQAVEALSAHIGAAESA